MPKAKYDEIYLELKQDVHGSQKETYHAVNQSRKLNKQYDIIIKIL